MKTPKSYRLSQTALNRLAWLTTELNDTETGIIELAITQLYMAEYYGLDYVRPSAYAKKNGE